MFLQIENVFSICKRPMTTGRVMCSASSFSKDWKPDGVVFPRIGWREARHKKFHGKNSKPWKKHAGFFQALEKREVPSWSPS
jgi:hypothetical protein